MVRKTLKKNRHRSVRLRKARKQRKLRGGDTPDMDYAGIIKAHILKQVIVNPKSKFVVCTYWWGRGNANKNYLRFGDEVTDKAVKNGDRVNYACTGEIIEQVKYDLIEEMREEEEEEQAIEKAIADGMFDEPEEFYTISKERRIAILKKYPLKYSGKKVQSILDRPEIKKKITDLTNQRTKQYEANGQIRHPATKFEDMIDTWKKMCEKVGCNYIVEEYPEFAFPGKYQLAINLKPLFIKAALAVAGAQGRGVLYIDGDMTITQYPPIFDMPTVDFMARGWNVDPRASTRYLSSVCFDPYIFETSGGTMFFAPTRQAVLLLNAWSKINFMPEMQGKAEDRILSMVFTKYRQGMSISSIQLPIEYLWLNDAYTFQKPEDIDISKVYIEHPACLTSEEAAREQGAADSREPPGYEKVISDVTYCDQPGGIFYEYIFFTERKFVDSFAPWLKYLRKAKNDKGQSFFQVVDFDQKYGPYNKVAYKNMEESNLIKDVKTGGRVATLPQTATVPQILAHLRKGIAVVLGNYTGEFSEVYDIVAVNNGTEYISEYQTGVDIDITKPIFFGPTNPVLIHLLMMCTTLADINKHYHQSFLFYSRIRGLWTKTDRGTPKK